MQKILPPLVLTIICIAVSGLLAFANALTEPKIKQAQVDKLNESLSKVFGDDAEYEISSQTYDGVTQVITDNQNRIIFDITIDGYNKKGIQALIGINEVGEVCGVSIVSITETPGLGTKILDNGYLDKFLGLSDKNAITEDTIITGATYSSKGMQNAVTLALNTYNENKEAILNE